MQGKLYIKIVIVALSVLSMAIAQQRMPEQLPAVLGEYVFVSGGAAGIEELATPWADRWVRWTVQSEVGTLASSRDQTDKQGRLSLRFEVPDVRAAVQMVLSLKPDGVDEEAAGRLDLVVLPKEPFADVRKTLGELGVGLLPSKIMTAALKRSGLQYVQLQHDLARGSFRGRVVILGSLIGENLASTRQWIASLPAGTCVIVVNDGGGEKSAFSLIEYLRAKEPPEESMVFIEKRSLVWTDLSADWLGVARCPAERLVEPKGLTSLKILAGQMGEDGSVYPLVMECKDFGGRRWLIWNLPELPAENDPRWDLLLRNSLLWAQKYISTDKGQQSADKVQTDS